MGASRHCRGKWFCKTWSIEIVKSSILLFTLFNISPTAGIGMRWFQGSGIWLALVPLGCSVFTYFALDFQPLALSSFKAFAIKWRIFPPVPGIVHSRAMISVVYCFNSMESFSYGKLNLQWKSGTQVVGFMDVVWQTSLSETRLSRFQSSLLMGT